jgi:hypothetical protein
MSNPLRYFNSSPEVIAQSGAGTACDGVDDTVDDCALKADLLRLLASIGVEKG